MKEREKLASWLLGPVFQQREQPEALSSSSGVCPVSVDESEEAIVTAGELSKERRGGEAGWVGQNASF